MFSPIPQISSYNCLKIWEKAYEIVCGPVYNYQTNSQLKDIFHKDIDQKLT